MDIKEVNEYIKNVLKEEKTNEAFTPLEDVCPVCSSEDIEFGSLNSELPDGVYYECICNNCGATFNQWYDVTFSGQYHISADKVEYDGPEDLPA